MTQNASDGPLVGSLMRDAELALPCLLAEPTPRRFAAKIKQILVRILLHDLRVAFERLWLSLLLNYGYFIVILLGLFFIVVLLLFYCYLYVVITIQQFSHLVLSNRIGHPLGQSF